MVKRRSGAWKLRQGLKGRETECAVSAVCWASEPGQSRVGCVGGSQRPACPYLEVWPEVLGENFILRLLCAPPCDWDLFPSGAEPSLRSSLF